MKMKLQLLILAFVLHITLQSGTKKNKNRKGSKKGLNLKKLSKSENEAVLSGYEEAFELCQYNFKLERWNCPKPDTVQNARHPISFTDIYKEATKETSYVYSIVAAGVTHHMIRACQQGHDKNCQCKKAPKNGLGASVVTCQQNIEHGLKRAKRILRSMDYKKVTDPVRRLFNWRNAVTGLQVYKENMPTECRCHGVSGHCTAQACWRTTPPSLKVPSKKLKDLYNKAVKLTSKDIQLTSKDINKPLITTVQSPPARNRPTRTLLVNDTKLVYVTDSPDYCKPNTKLGILGTLNRECDHKDDSCNKLCSSCGHRKHSFVRKVSNPKCNCKFIWCCKVECSTCIEKKVITQCLPPS